MNLSSSTVVNMVFCDKCNSYLESLCKVHLSTMEFGRQQHQTWKEYPFGNPGSWQEGFLKNITERMNRSNKIHFIPKPDTA